MVHSTSQLTVAIILVTLIVFGVYITVQVLPLPTATVQAWIPATTTTPIKTHAHKLKSICTTGSSATTRCRFVHQFSTTRYHFVQKLRSIDNINIILRSSSTNEDDESSSYSMTTTTTSKGLCRARDLMKSLIEEELCYTTEAGAIEFANVCAYNCIYEDRFEPQPIVGKSAIQQHMIQKVKQRLDTNTNNNNNKLGYRIDKISDGDAACGYTWTWIWNNDEGLRGTTFVELNDSGEIQYVQEIPEPIFKPGDMTKDLLRFVTKDAVPTPSKPYIKKVPTIANEIAKYMYIDLQGANRVDCMDELLTFFDTNVVYCDFNYKEPFLGHKGVKQLVLDFDFPGIIFRPLRFDDGYDSTCFTWEVVLGEDAPDTIKGITFLELDPVSRKIMYIRDIPESAIKPPILGKLARQFNPGLGVFKGVPISG